MSQYIYIIFKKRIPNKRQRIPKGERKLDNQDKLATKGTQEEEKRNTICAGHHYRQASTNRVHKK